MTASDGIRDSINHINGLRVQQASNSRLRGAIQEIKRLQAQRFAGTYSDLLSSPEFGPAANFFLTELYGAKDFSDRDNQFSRIASAIDRIFPPSVMDTALLMASVHRLTEELDHQMGALWLEHSTTLDVATRYVICWRQSCLPSRRQEQLQGVLALGVDLTKLTKKKGLLMLLKMMRRPAHAAGLSSLQAFLEQGFETFATMNQVGGGDGANRFLAQVGQRERAWISRLFDGPEQEVASELRACLSGIPESSRYPSS